MSVFKAVSAMSSVVLLAAVLCSCAGKPLVAERPKDEGFRMELKKELSTINVPVEASTDELARALNQSISSELYRGSANSGGLNAILVRNGNISISASENSLFVTLPIAMSLSYRVFETPSIPLKLKFRIKAEVTPDWRLKTDVSYIGLSDLLAEDMKIGFLSFKPRKIVDDLVSPLQQKLSGQISQKINEQFHLKNEVATVWNMAHKPILMEKGFNAWLKLTPSEVMLYPLYAHDNRVKLSVGISTFAEMVVGPEPASQPPQPLPDLRLVNSFDRTFRIALNTDLYYSDLRPIAEKLLLNKTFVSDGRSFTVRDFELYGNGDRLVVKLQTEGALDGIIYLTARPAFNSATNIFSLEDVDFDMQTRSLLLKSADWLLHGTIREMIHEKLNLNLTERLEKTRLMACKSLERLPLTDAVFMRGDIKALRFNDMVVQKNKVSVQVYAEGETAVVF
jgi:hypothetical protein